MAPPKGYPHPPHPSWGGVKSHGQPEASSKILPVFLGKINLSPPIEKMAFFWCFFRFFMDPPKMTHFGTMCDTCCHMYATCAQQSCQSVHDVHTCAHTCAQKLSQVSSTSLCLHIFFTPDTQMSPLVHTFDAKVAQLTHFVTNFSLNTTNFSSKVCTSCHKCAH